MLISYLSLTVGAALSALFLNIGWRMWRGDFNITDRSGGIDLGVGPNAKPVDPRDYD